MWVGCRLVRALAQQLLGEAGLIVVVPGLSHLHLEFDLVLWWIVLRRLLGVALHSRRPHLTVCYIVVAAIDHFLCVRRYVTTAKVASWLRLTVLVLLVVPLLLFIRLLSTNRLNGVR